MAYPCSSATFLTTCANSDMTISLTMPAGNAHFVISHNGLDTRPVVLSIWLPLVLTFQASHMTH
ncbi:hypothetical protein PILCRDRAFT_826962 [Piloderma croceum F 1598]|uniref:Uncharacterized protein n=1 Tax=Piloderma croceum (strain F 1598) TaxID=765440 RepID=A0A0C3F7D7_PILCF|nr:hypothetical protein PILCRDRAFT_826962 [Piloderma croceum F 1598]